MVDGHLHSLSGINGKDIGKPLETAGYDNNTGKPQKGYWMDTNNRVAAMAGIIDFLGKYPTIAELENKLKLGCITAAIQRYDGGLIKFGETYANVLEDLLGYEISFEEFRHESWKDLDDRISTVSGLIDFSNRSYPKFETFREMKFNGLLSSIQKKDGGLDKFLYDNKHVLEELVGYDILTNKKLPGNYWKSLDNRISAMAGIIDFLGKYPKARDVAKMGGGLLDSIQKKDGGLDDFKNKYKNILIDLTGNKIIDGTVLYDYWNDPDNRVGAMACVTDIFGRYPKTEEMQELGLNGLLHAIYENDGSLGEFKSYHKTDFENLLGYELDYMPRNYWSALDNRLGAVASLITFFGRYPKYKELVGMKLRALGTAIYRKDGGWESFRNKNKKLLEELTGYKISNSVEKFLADMKTDDMKILVSKLGLDRGTMWDILSVKYGVERSRVVDIMKSEPSLGPYMGEFVTGINGIEDWDYVAERTLPYDDDNETIRKILEKSLFDSVLSRLGPTPKMGSVDEEIGNLMSNVNRKMETIRKVAKRGEE